MKQLLRILCPVVLLTLFAVGCGSPESELTTKVPDSASVIFYMDVAAMLKTPAVAKEMPQLEKSLAEHHLTPGDFACRFLAFGSIREKWGAVLVRSREKQAEKLFEFILREARKNNRKVTENADGKKRIIRFQGTDKDSVMGILYHENLMLAAFARQDPAFFRSRGKNPLLKDIHFDHLASAVLRVEWPKDIPQTDMAAQMLPCLRKMQTVTVNSRLAGENVKTEIDFIFSDGGAAGEALGALNMGLGFAAARQPELVAKLERGIEKNRVFLRFDSAFAEELSKTGKALVEKRKTTSSLNNLKQIGLACVLYASDHGDRLPDGFTDLVKGNYLTLPKVFIAESDTQSKPFVNQTITAKNTTYAYVGKGLMTRQLKRPAATPMAFEKPRLVKSGKIAVLYVDGHVSLVPAPAVKTCKALADTLTGSLPDAEKNLIRANAVTEDRNQ